MWTNIYCFSLWVYVRNNFLIIWAIKWICNALFYQIIKDIIFFTRKALFIITLIAKFIILLRALYTFFGRNIFKVFIRTILYTFFSFKIKKTFRALLTLCQKTHDTAFIKYCRTFCANVIIFYINNIANIALSNTFFFLVIISKRWALRIYWNTIIFH